NALILAAGVTSTVSSSIAACCSLSLADDASTTQGDDLSIVAAYGVQTTATNISSSSFEITGEGNSLRPEASIVFALVEQQEDGGLMLPPRSYSLIPFPNGHQIMVESEQYRRIY